MKIFRCLILFSALLMEMVFSVASAQDSYTLKGVVLDMDTKTPIENARISIVGEQIPAVFTNSEGSFSLESPKQDIQLISIMSSGYTSIERFVSQGLEVLVYLQKEADYSPDKNLESLSGGGTLRQSNKAIESVNFQGLKNASVESVDEYLKRSTAYTTSISGAPGEGAVVSIRGVSSLFSDTRPLWIVDGLILSEHEFGGGALKGYNTNPLLNINPEDIAEVVILKDAAATAIYGSRAANGVIAITTKRPRSGETSFNVTGYYGMNFKPEYIPMMSGDSYKNYLQTQMFSAGMTGSDVYNSFSYFDDEVSDDNPRYYNYNKDTDWQNEVFQAQSKTGAKLDVSGGDAVARYYISGYYSQNRGNITNTINNQYGMRINTDVDITSSLHLYSNMAFTYMDAEQFEQGILKGTNPVYSALIKPSFMTPFQYNREDVKLSVRNDADALGFSNPSALVANGGGTNSSLLFNGNMSFVYDFNERSYLNFALGMDYSRFRDQVFYPDFGVTYSQDPSAKQFVSEGVSSLRATHAEVTFNLDDRSVQSEFFTMIGGFRLNSKSVRQDIGWGKDTGSDQFQTLDRVSSIGLNKRGFNLDYHDVGFFVNGDVNYLNKYFLKGTLSADMASSYGIDSYSKVLDAPTSLSYAIGGAWDIGEELEMDKRIVSLLKMRASWGKVINQGIGAFRSKDYYVSRQYSTVAGLVKGNLVNTSLSGENLFQTNFGVDAFLLSNKLSITADYYINKTDNLLSYITPPEEYGISDKYWDNQGALTTKGWEFSLRGTPLSRNVKWTLGATLGTYSQELNGLSEDYVINVGDGQKIFTNGKAPGLFYGYQSNGVISTNQEAQNLNLRNVNGMSFTAGDIHFDDLNTDHVIDSKDKTYLDDPAPDFYGSLFSSLKYGVFTLDLDFAFSYGNEVYNASRQVLESMSGYENQTIAVERRWVIDGHQTDIPKAVYGDPMGNSAFSSRWIEDGSYLRLSNITLTADISRYAKFVNNAQVYLTGNNLFTITSYKGYDPEFASGYSIIYQGVDYGKFPQVSSVCFGIKLGL